MSHRRGWLWLLPILLLTFWLGAHYMNLNPFYGDERNSLRDAGGYFHGPLNLGEVWTRVATVNPSHPPGFFMLLNQWAALVSWRPFALRMFSLLLGMLTIAWTYRLGRDFLSPRAGLVGAAILTTSMLFAYYLTEVRMYALVALVSTFTLWCYFTLLKNEPVSRFVWLGLWVGAVGIFYSHYLATFVLVGMGVYHLLFVPKTKRWWQISGILTVAALLFLPWISVLVAGIDETLGKEGLHEDALTTGQFLAQWAYFFGNSLPVLLVILLLLAIGQRLFARSSSWPLNALWVVTITILGMAIASNLVFQMFTEDRLRYLIGMQPPLALLLGAGLLWATGRIDRRLWLPALAVWMGLGILTTNARVASTAINNVGYIFPLHSVSDVLEGHYQTNDLIINYLPDRGLSRLDHDQLSTYFLAPDSFFMLRTEADPNDWQERIDEAIEEISSRERVWLAHAPDQPLPGAQADFEAALNAAGYARCVALTDSSTIRVDLFTREPICCENYDRLEPSLATFGDAIRLTKIQIDPISAGSLPLILTWGFDASIPAYTYSVSLQLLDESGQVVAQTDEGLDLPAFTCKRTALPVDGVPPGDYRLHATVYDWQTGARLPGRLATNGEMGELLPLAMIEIDD
jgi:hypothetical protein